MHIIQLLGQEAPPGCFAVRPHLDGVPCALAVTLTSEEDKFERRLQKHLEEFHHAPFFDRADDRKTIEYIAQRGQNLAQSAFSALAGRAIDVLKDDWILEIVGGESLFGQAWETLRMEQDGPPLALKHPIVRRIPNTQGIAPAPSRADGARVLVFTSRSDPALERPPRLITGPLAAIAEASGGRLKLASIVAPDPIRLAELLRRGRREPQCEILHIDGHGVQLPFDAYARMNTSGRTIFERTLGLRPLPQYAGSRAFVLFDWGDGPVAVDGAQLASLGIGLGVRAIVLNACRAGAVGVAGALACDLVRAGIPDVVAVRHNLTERGAELFAIGFYASVANGHDVTRSVCAARASMFARRLRRTGHEDVEVHDWLSVVHYAAVAGHEPHGLTGIAAGASDPLTEISWPQMFVSGEWAVFAAQKQLAQRWMKGPRRHAILFVGPMGAGMESLAAATADWLSRTDPWWGGSLYVDARQILGTEESQRPALWRDTAKAVIGQDANVILAVPDGELVDLDEKDQFDALAGFLRAMCEHDVLVVLSLSQTPFSDDSVPFSATQIAVFPLDFSEIFDAVCEGSVMPSARRLALYCVAGHFAEISGTIGDLPEHLAEEALDYFVLGLRPSPGCEARIAPLRDRVLHRLGPRVLTGEGQAGDASDPAGPLVSVLGSGISVFDLERFDRPFGNPGPTGVDDRFRSRAKRCIEYIAAGLASYPDPRRSPNEWHEQTPKGWFVNPHLRPYFRSTMTAAELERLDRWALGYADFKLRALRNTFDNQLTSESLREEMRAYFNIGIPFFIATLWMARRRSWDASKLLREVSLARKAGLWPSALEAQTIAGQQMEQEADATSDEETPFSAALQAALSHRDSRQRADAIRCAEAAIGLAETDQAKAISLEILGTIYVDQGDSDLAERQFQEAERIIRKVGPRERLGEIIYQRAGILQAKSHEDEPRWQDAKARYREAVETGLATGQLDLVCRCFANMADMELKIMPAGMDPSEHPAWLTRNLLQAEDYLNRADSAAREAGSFEERQIMLIALRARLAAVRNDGEHFRRLIAEGKRLIPPSRAFEQEVLTNLEIVFGLLMK